MAQQEGGRWDVGGKSGAVYLERRGEDNEGLFEARLEPEEARELAALLTKYADKADPTEENDSRDKDDSSDDDSGEEDSSDEDSTDKDDSSDEGDSSDDSSD